MTDVVRDVVTAFQAPGKPVQGLPADAYVNDDFWQRECNTVLERNWICVGFRHEFQQPGDVRPVEIGGKPILLVLNAKGEIGGFHNACRHRCLKLVDAPGNAGKLIRCPYHAWAYDLDGALRASPHFGGTDNHRPDGFDPAQNGLVPVRVHVWHDWIFVNPDGKADPFETYAAALIWWLSDLELGRAQVLGVLDFGEIKGNWKLVMENFIEPYHVQFVHATTTDHPLNKHYTVVDGRCLGSAIDLDEDGGSGATLAVSSRFLTLFPNFIIGRYFPDQLGVYLNVPLGPGRTAQKRALYSTEGQEFDAEQIEALKTLWWNVHKEDHEMIERLQKGRASPVAAKGGVLSPVWEDSVRAFQELVVENLQPEEAI